jgi:serine/threonine protein kinase
LAIVCPYCKTALVTKSTKPGRYRPLCPTCDKPFLVIVSNRAGETVKVRALEGLPNPVAKDKHTTAVGHSFVLEVAGTSDAKGQFVVAETQGIDRAAEIPTDRPPPLAAKGEGARDAKPADQPAASENDPARLEIKGYTIERELGRGGMGTVYLARQHSLDRHVALKVMSRRWANDPIFVSRFTREAYAAAQLSHPNIVQIFDIGEANGTRYFSMEYVPGRTLAELLKQRGKLDPETAVGYILQAARGLKHAHDRGMVHRDVKPDNLMLDEQGLVKLGDLGLVKTPATRRHDDSISGEPSDAEGGLNSLPHDVTGARIALGTPAYMSPEQCRDAANVDHRADVYSLGCTLYVLVTGRQPFDGTTAVELMTKHAYEPLVPPEHIVARVPREVSEIIQRMMAKEADDRFQSMGEVIRTLEGWLGIHRAGTFSPHDEQISRLEGYVHQFNHSPTVAMRRRVLTGFLAAVALSTVLIAFFGKLAWAFGVLGMLAQAMVAYFILDGVTRRGHLFVRTRQFVFGLTWGDWAIGAAGFALFAILMAMLNVLWIWTGFGLIGIGLAFALRYGIDRSADEEVREPVEACERMLRRLRAQGLDEEELQHFVAKYSGRDWEGFFEALFGYEAKLAARAVLLRGGAAGIREKHGTWREPLIAAMDRVEKNRRTARERRLLQAVERAELLAAGAGKKVEGTAGAPDANDIQGEVPTAHSVDSTPGGGCKAGGAEQGLLLFSTNAPRDPASAFVNLFVGSHVRFVLAAALVAACGLWVHQNQVLLASGSQTAAHGFGKPTQPLEVQGIPAAATAWVDGWNIGVAGVLLLASLCCRGNVMSIFVLLGAAVAAVGHQYGIRTVEPFRSEHVALMLGFVLALVGFRAGRPS